VLLYVMMSRLALPRVRQVLEDRNRRIDGNLRKAESLKADAEAAAAAYEKAMAAARADAQEVLREGRATAAAEAAARHAELGKRLEAEVAAAEARIADAKREAIAGIRDVAIEVSTSVVARLMGEGVKTTSIAKAVDGALKERA
jgi:F-type H+-transporting ATPase subunit b